MSSAPHPSSRKRKRTPHDQGIKPPRTPLPLSVHHLAAQDFTTGRHRDGESQPARSASPSLRTGNTRTTLLTLEDLRRKRAAYERKNEKDRQRRRRMKAGAEDAVDANDEDLERRVEDDDEEHEVQPAYEPDLAALTGPDDNLPSSDLLHAIHHYASHFYDSMSIIGTLTTPAEYAKIKRDRAAQRSRAAADSKAVEVHRTEETPRFRSASASPSASSQYETRRGRSTSIRGSYSMQQHPMDGRVEMTMEATEEPAMGLQTITTGRSSQNPDEKRQAAVLLADRPERLSASPAPSSINLRDKDNPDDGAGIDDVEYAGKRRDLDFHARWRKEKKRDMKQAFDGSALMALGILVQEKTVQLLKQAGYVEDTEKAGDNIDLDALFPRLPLNRPEEKKRRRRGSRKDQKAESTAAEPVKKKRGRPRLYPPDIAPASS